MKLLLDLGNTRLKWALQDRSDWLAFGAGSWDDELPALERQWRDLPPPRAAWGASVVDGAREQAVARAVQASLGVDIAWVRTPAAACGVENGYREPATLGIDRFLAMVAAHAERPVPWVIASAGTALTLDALAADGRHLGGLIAPGPWLMRQALLDATARVNPRGEGRIVAVADNTADGLASGCWQASAALIERFMARMAPRLGGEPVLRLDGGDAGMLLGLLEVPAERVEHGVLRGLAVWAEARPAAPAAARMPPRSKGKP